MRRSSKPLPKDPNKLAFEIVRMSTEGQDEHPKEERSPISEYLAKIGRKGGLKGGKARAAKLSAKLRKEIATEAARKRWGKKSKS
ncbi:MAG: hypothetical protein ABSA46_22035 [Thermodesulfovibrionales bacterium]|jgi:hypothetical protein